MSRLSTTKCHWLAVGSLAIVRCTCATKSASVRVGPLDGLKTCPVATSKLMKNEQGAVTFVLELAPRYVTRPRRQVWRQSLQCLDARHFVRAHRPLAPFSAFGCGAIDGTHVSYLGVTIGVGGRGKPVPHSVRLQVGRFSTTARHGAARCGQ